MAWGMDGAAVNDREHLKGARASGEGNNTAWEKERTVKACAHHATDVDEFAEFLDMLGLRSTAVGMAKTAARRKAAA